MSNKNLFDLSGKVALITGASRGIGESIARLLAQYGAHVIVSSRKIDGCERVAASIRDAGGRAEAVACHIGEMDQIDALWAHIDRVHGRIDILVNNAAANPYFGPVEDTDPGAFQKTVDVNIRGYFFMSAQAARRMKPTGGGAIVNVASVNGVNPGHFQGIYSVTKAAVIAMTKSFAMELGPRNIRVNALLPGLTDTKFASALTTNESIKKQALAHIPMKRVADPDEMAGTVLYLVSDASSYTTGACINADGGYLTV
ncbi:SDR family oxidoreductase [Marinobacter lutaoensis]|jgi:NAD(P)-dependent dehydrogenase (short-subunit alcohol dehydrogenase family)|uniref:Short-chain dehydrogenase n=1 Tax=Marinobacter lutaoensis TaxID=135739 RepID=A0A1V2DQE9_9GAMM|nr:SDR family oxidoreductase [Marinobacter lutaoensis]MBE01882.1 short-chain dehydrogenase [Marinobacter sp.]MBI42965.1 short-chain dehydrogenase [Oceanospirillales bacterium]NVD34581.1 SDR family oxidoreductase [Marinobacter lutaoensis]ONF42882.1 short-chain dehydrogenase [Marinobacter lutaoensis]|tara:strand:+ start:578 stop:1348 length:771 start_codon:yes stop_codon:yes gene_type:complete